MKREYLRIFRHDITTPQDPSPYMRRWVLRTSWGDLRLHHILRSDSDREYHDHPFDFWSFILWGGYWEHSAHYPEGKWFGPGSLVQKRAGEAHRLRLPENSPAWTVVWTGPKYRDWGFHTAQGWVHWREWMQVRGWY